ncbi:hypothetical protein [Acinetobacter defluvii]|uniref:hypothetical protein n=1 Tax=Acinetobacter defluvii TaxID=1871111 RepID=UPI0014904BB5|nr:hypothetical protein [Acinetobacter defluvii]
MSHILFSWSLTNKGVTMNKYYPELDTVSDIIEQLPHPQCKPIAHAIRICNDQDQHLVAKLHAITLALL